MCVCVFTHIPSSGGADTIPSLLGLLVFVTTEVRLCMRCDEEEELRFESVKTMCHLSVC